MVLPCHPTKDVAEIKLDIKRKFGVPISHLSRLSPERLCEVYTSCSKGKFKHLISPPGMTPARNSDGKSYLIDLKGAMKYNLTIDDYLVALGTDSEDKEIIRVAKKLGIVFNKHESASSMRMTIIDQFVALKLKEPILVPFKITKKIQEQIMNTDSNKNINFVVPESMNSGPTPPPPDNSGPPLNSEPPVNSGPAPPPPLNSGPTPPPPLNSGPPPPKLSEPPSLAPPTPVATVSMGQNNIKKQLEKIQKINEQNKAKKPFTFPQVDFGSKKNSKRLGQQLSGIVKGFSQGDKNKNVKPNEKTSVKINNKKEHLEILRLITTRNMAGLLVSYLNSNRNADKFAELYNFLKTMQDDITSNRNTVNAKLLRKQYTNDKNRVLNYRAFKIKKFSDELEDILKSYTPEQLRSLKKMLTTIKNNASVSNELLHNVSPVKLSFTEKYLSLGGVSEKQLFNMIKNNPKEFLQQLNLNINNSYIPKQSGKNLEAVLEMNTPEEYIKWFKKLTSEQRKKLKKRLEMIKKPPTTNNKTPATNNKTPATNNKTPATNNKPPAANNKPPTANNKPPAANNNVVRALKELQNSVNNTGRKLG